MMKSFLVEIVHHQKVNTSEMRNILSNVEYQTAAIALGKIHNEMATDPDYKIIYWCSDKLVVELMKNGFAENPGITKKYQII